MMSAPKHKKETNKTPYGRCLRCPNCDGFNFYMYRNNLGESEELYEIADCLGCHSTTYAFALKDKYHEDKGKDFEIIGRIKHIITFECGECQRQYRDKKIYEETIYANTTFSDIDPEPIWKCPQHPNAKGCLLIDDIPQDYDNDVNVLRRHIEP